MIKVIDAILYRLTCLLLAVAIILLPLISLSVVPRVYAILPWFTYPNVTLVTGMIWLSMAVTFLLHNILSLLQK